MPDRPRRTSWLRIKPERPTLRRERRAQPFVSCLTPHPVHAVSDGKGLANTLAYQRNVVLLSGCCVIPALRSRKALVSFLLFCAHYLLCWLGRSPLQPPFIFALLLLSLPICERCHLFSQRHPYPPRRRTPSLRFSRSRTLVRFTSQKARVSLSRLASRPTYVQEKNAQRRTTNAGGMTRMSYAHA